MQCITQFLSFPIYWAISYISLKFVNGNAKHRLAQIMIWTIHMLLLLPMPNWFVEAELWVLDFKFLILKKNKFRFLIISIYLWIPSHQDNKKVQNWTTYIESLRAFNFHVIYFGVRALLFTPAYGKRLLSLSLSLPTWVPCDNFNYLISWQSRRSLYQKMEEGNNGTIDWLQALVETNFSEPCQLHRGMDAKRKFYCIDCRISATCEGCKDSKHPTHEVLRIIRSTLLDAIKAVELKELLADDIDSIQLYKCNSDMVVYLLPRGASNGNLHYRCERCNHKLNDNKRFCSLGCMVDDKVVKNNGPRKKRKQSRPERSHGPEIVWLPSLQRWVLNWLY